MTSPVVQGRGRVSHAEHPGFIYQKQNMNK
jgi:hypothetical protein